MKDDGPARDDAPDSAQSDWLEEPLAGRVGLSALAATFVLGVVTSLLVVLAWGLFPGNDPEDGSTDPTSLAGASEPLDGTAETDTSDTDTSDTDTSDTDTSDTDTSDTGVGASADRPLYTRLSRCASASQTMASALEAARPSLDQWAVHVGAMNKLVVGEITLQQATAFWEQTRVGAQRRVADFREAMEALQQHGVDCPSSALLAPGSRALPGCVRQVEAQVGAIRAATTSINTWDQHVQHMDMMRLGQLSPEDATQMWLSMWQQGVRDLDAYRAAAREAGELDGCDRIGSAQ